MLKLKFNESTSVVCIHNGIYLAVRKNKTMHFLVAWMGLEVISEKERNRHKMFSLRCET